MIEMSDWKEEILKKWKAKEAKPKVLITDEIRDRIAREFKGEALYREPMSKHTSMRVGGIADVYLKPSSIEDIAAILKLAKEEELPLTYLGSGSNTLVRDGGIRGLVLSQPASLMKCELIEEGESTGDILAGAGVGISATVNFAKDHGLTGMEELIGIPGSIGGAVVMNAGARGREMADVIREITVMEAEGEIKTLPREKLEFSYRHLKIPRSTVVLSARLRLDKDDVENITVRIKEYQQKRAQTQPLNYPNLGSVFKNPLPPKDGKRGIFAAQLIEDAGLKNVRVGGARVSEKHANFIINEKEAKAKDVMVLIQLIKDRVRESSGVKLECEVKVIGEE